jgi:hypothetical protein
MGMLFNTDATLKLLDMANNAFNVNGWTKIKANAPLVATFNAAGPYNTYKHVATLLQIDHVEPGKSKRWKWWLDNCFDLHCAGIVYPAIATAITDPQCSAVEFFAVPVLGALGAATAVVVQIPDSESAVGAALAGLYTLVIEIKTNTYDALGGP